RPAVLDGVAQAMQRADPGISAPGKHQLFRTAHADKLVIDQIGSHADESEALAALTDDLVAGRMRNKVREPLHGHRIAVVQGRLNGGGKGNELGHRHFPGVRHWNCYLRIITSAVKYRVNDLAHPDLSHPCPTRGYRRGGPHALWWAPHD